MPPWPSGTSFAAELEEVYPAFAEKLSDLGGARVEKLLRRHRRHSADHQANAAASVPVCWARPIHVAAPVLREPGRLQRTKAGIRLYSIISSARVRNICGAHFDWISVR